MPAGTADRADVGIGLCQKHGTNRTAQERKKAANLCTNRLAAMPASGCRK